jgi:GNAT superfamily N-acetyltransferase
MSSSACTVANSAQGDVARLGAHHLAQGLALSQALNWPYRAEDWAFAFALGCGFAVEANGRLAGTALWWPYGDDHASAGMIIVAADAQRQGIGARLMDALLADAAGRTIILNSTPEGEPLYTRLGFRASGRARGGAPNRCRRAAAPGPARRSSRARCARPGGFGDGSPRVA